jgi:hypothetical protein
MVSVTPRPRFSPGERTPVPIVQKAGWAPGPIWTQAREGETYRSKHVMKKRIRRTLTFTVLLLININVCTSFEYAAEQWAGASTVPACATGNGGRSHISSTCNTTAAYLPPSQQAFKVAVFPPKFSLYFLLRNISNMPYS